MTLTDVFIAQGKVLMGVARWEWEQKEQATTKRAKVATELKRLQLHLAQAEAVARLQVVQTEMEARSAEMALLIEATGSASKLVKTDRAVLREMRHADERRPPRRESRSRLSVADAMAMRKPTSVVPPLTDPVRVRLRLYVSGNARTPCAPLTMPGRSAPGILTRSVISKLSICLRSPFELWRTALS